MRSTGTAATFLHPLEGLHGDAGIVASGDVALFVSHSGRGGEIEELLPILRRLGAPVIALTGGATSPVGRAADVVLETGSPDEACPFGLVPTSSSTAALALGDALAMNRGAGNKDCEDGNEVDDGAHRIPPVMVSGRPDTSREPAGFRTTDHTTGSSPCSGPVDWS